MWWGIERPSDSTPHIDPRIEMGMTEFDMVLWHCRVCHALSWIGPNGVKHKPHCGEERPEALEDD